MGVGMIWSLLALVVLVATVLFLLVHRRRQRLDRLDFWRTGTMSDNDSTADIVDESPKRFPIVDLAIKVARLQTQADEDDVFYQLSDRLDFWRTGRGR